MSKEQLKKIKNMPINLFAHESELKDAWFWLIQQAERVEEYRLESHDLQDMNRENIEKIEELEAEKDTLSMAHDNDKKEIRELEQTIETGIHVSNLLRKQNKRYREALDNIIKDRISGKGSHGSAYQHARRAREGVN